MDSNATATGLEKGTQTTLIVCCTLCCLVIGNAVNVCAIVFGFQEYEDEDACPGGYDICSTECQEKAFMDVSLFLQIVGFSLMGLSIVSVCSHFLICPPPNPELEPQKPSKPQLGFSVIIMLYNLAWVIVGFVLYNDLTGDCTSTPKGKMLLAWNIIYAVSLCGNFSNLRNQF